MLSEQFHFIAPAFGGGAGVRRLRRFAPYFLLIAIISLTSCGGKSPSESTKSNLPPSGLTAHRAWITNEFAGRLTVLDVAKDELTASTILIGSAPEFIVPIAGGLALVYDKFDNGVNVVDKATEEITGNRIILPGFTEQIVVTADGKTGYAPIRSAAAVAVLDLTARTVSTQITGISGIRRLVMNKAGTKILAFSDNQDSFFVINTSDNSKTQVSGLDRPFYGVFSSDDSKAYILNCGAECGGVSASVSSVDMATLAVGASVPVSGATVGLSDGTNLYVAGTPSPGNGTLDVITLSTFTRSTSSSVPITDGLHWLMAAANGKLYIGARGCTIAVNGCLTIYTISGGTVTFSKPNGQANVVGDVTSIEPIKDRTVTYVIEAGNLRIYDQKTDLPQAKQIDISGKVFDVKQID
jgi:hypothetical protein